MDPRGEVVSFSAEVAVEKQSDFTNWQTLITGLEEALGAEDIVTLWTAYQNIGLQASIDGSSSNAAAADAAAVNTFIVDKALTQIEAIALDSVDETDLNIIRIVVRSLSLISKDEVRDFLVADSLQKGVSVMESLIEH